MKLYVPKYAHTPTHQWQSILPQIEDCQLHTQYDIVKLFYCSSLSLVVVQGGDTLRAVSAAAQWVKRNAKALKLARSATTLAFVIVYIRC